MASVTIKRNHHWSDDTQPYTLVVNNVSQGNLYDNQSKTIELPEGTHEICLHLNYVEKFKTTITVKGDVPLSVSFDINNKVALWRYALAAIFTIITFFSLNSMTEYLLAGGVALSFGLYYWASRQKSIEMTLA